MKAIATALETESRLCGPSTTQEGRTPVGAPSLLGLRIRDVVDVLRRQYPGISKKEIRQKLEDMRFDFRGKKPGNAIHMAWVWLEAREKKTSGNER